MFVNAIPIAYTIHYIKFLRSCKFFSYNENVGENVGEIQVQKRGKRGKPATLGGRFI